VLAVIEDLEDMFAFLRLRSARRNRRPNRHVASEATTAPKAGKRLLW
jgi:hypothetical protein